MNNFFSRLIHIGALHTKLNVELEEAGQLEAKIPEYCRFNIVQLTVSGPINGTDLKLLRAMAGYNRKGRTSKGRLRQLDLSQARFVPGGSHYARDHSGNELFIERHNAIPARAFRKCVNLRELILPKFIDRIEGHAFERCRNLSTIVIPESVTSIGNRAFRHCRNLNTITLPCALQELGQETFAENRALHTVFMLSPQPPVAPSNTFFNLNLKYATLNVPEESIEAYRSVSLWAHFGTIAKV